MMKRNIMTVAFVAAIALIAGINVYHAQKTVTLSDIAMENVEALAMNEGNSGITCYYKEGGPAFLCKCRTCTWGYVYTNDSGKCYAK